MPILTQLKPPQNLHRLPDFRHSAFWPMNCMAVHQEME
jgi:hypothetical protein